MTVVALCTPAGSSGSTTTALLAAAMAPPSVTPLAAECDPSGGDLAAWAEASASPGWATAIAGADRSWPGLAAHTQELPSGLRMLAAPSRASEARTVVDESARGFAAVLSTSPDVLAFADCGRIGQVVPTWAVRAQLALLLVRQVAGSAPATVAVVDRAIESLDALRDACPRVGVVLIGAAPYPSREIEAAFGVPLFASLPDDRAGAAAVSGGWTLGRRSGRSPLAAAAGELTARVIDSVPAPVVAPPSTTVAHEPARSPLTEPLRVVP